MSKDEKSPTVVARYRILFKGIVQGVGFRPYLYRSAQKYNLSGFVKNTSEGVILEVEGITSDIDAFIPYVLNHFPPLAEVVDYKISQIPGLSSNGFEILSSENTDKSDLLVSPDIAVCDNCRKELTDPTDRRYRYPFINCTDCGPRMTIIQDLPYDRPKTTMAKFPMCPQCQKEYNDPLDRRYHAQPVSCFECGPTLSLLDGNGMKIDTSDPIRETCQKLKEGHVVAIKGIGGYHLACLANSDEAVLKLRRFKQREAKPFALMGTMDMIRENCTVSDSEERYLSASSAPILLLKRKEKVQVSSHVAPGQSTIGFMLPYTPLHVLLLDDIRSPLVMTSANLSDEPIVYQDDVAALRALSDDILTHDRDIHLFADDSVARVFDNHLYMIRRSRGFVPFPITLPVESPQTILALGPMMKTTFTMIRGNKALTGPYIGDTESPSAIEAERFAVRHYMKLFSIDPQLIAIDRHPLYPNRLMTADFKGSKVVEIQHHKAHVGALLAEKGETGPIIGIAMDGTGYGDDGKIWGGEFFVGDWRHITRVGHLKNLFLPSGDKAVKEPWRFALSILYSLYGSTGHAVRFAEQFETRGVRQLDIIASGQSGTGVLTSSCGRLFDAACSLLGLGHVNDFDGHLPSLLQTIAEESGLKGPEYDYSIEEQKEEHKNSVILNLLPLFHDIIRDGRRLQEKAFGFHRTLAKGIGHMADVLRDRYGINKAGLTGGVFQNTLLLELTMDELKRKGFEVLIHSSVPSNDGGISLGQAFLAVNAANPNDEIK
ncbi:MAG: carbamoyltransferase HypF [Candidatus Omnitrophota bacterium]